MFASERHNRAHGKEVERRFAQYSEVPRYGIPARLAHPTPPPAARVHHGFCPPFWVLSAIPGKPAPNPLQALYKTHPSVPKRPPSSNASDASSGSASCFCSAESTRAEAVAHHQPGAAWVVPNRSVDRHHQRSASSARGMSTCPTCWGATFHDPNATAVIWGKSCSASRGRQPISMPQRSTALCSVMSCCRCLHLARYLFKTTHAQYARICSDMSPQYAKRIYDHTSCHLIRSFKQIKHITNPMRAQVEV